MNRDIAKQFIEALALMELPLNLMDSAISNLDGKEKDKYTSGVAHLMQAHFELLMGIINLYPELDPDGAGAEAYCEFKTKRQD